MIYSLGSKYKMLHPFLNHMYVDAFSVFVHSFQSIVIHIEISKIFYNLVERVLSLSRDRTIFNDRDGLYKNS